MLKTRKKGARERHIFFFFLSDQVMTKKIKPRRREKRKKGKKLPVANMFIHLVYMLAPYTGCYYLHKGDCNRLPALKVFIT